MSGDRPTAQPTGQDDLRQGRGSSAPAEAVLLEPRPLRPALLAGTRIGVRTFAEMALAMVPAYFAALLLEKLGAIDVLSDWAEPVMGVLGLPGSAALPLVLACLLNIYAAIGAMQALPLSASRSPSWPS